MWYRFVHTRCGKTGFWYESQAPVRAFDVFNAGQALLVNGGRPKSGYQIMCPQCGVIIEHIDYLCLREAESLLDHVELARALGQQGRWD